MTGVRSYALCAAVAWFIGCTKDNSGGSGGGASSSTNAGVGAGGHGGQSPLEGCDGCVCTPVEFHTYETSLECFSCAYPFEPGTGPFGNGTIDVEWIYEYDDCHRRLIVVVAENPTIGHLLDTTTNEVVGAYYTDDSGVCAPYGTMVYAGELHLGFKPMALPGCTLTSCTKNGGPC